MYLIVGLGNPGSQYLQTRHNAGFMAVDVLAQRMSVSLSRKRFQGFAAEGGLADQKVLLLEPQTYMNLSGRAVGEALRFYAERDPVLIVVHDEADIPFGAVRIKKGGGHAGHNGLRSIIDVLSTSDFIRVRLGVGKPTSPIPLADYLLSAFQPEERDVLPDLIARGAQAVEAIVSLGLAVATNRVNAERPS